MRALAIVHQPDAGPGVFAEEIQERGVELDEWPIPDSEEPPADPLSYDAVLTFGGAMNVHELGAHPWIEPELELLRRLLDRGVPLLGACLGTQLLAKAAGGSVRRARRPEIGWFEVELTEEAGRDPVFGSLVEPSGGDGFEAFQWHSYEAEPPPGAVALAVSPVCSQAYRLGDRAWGIQFHAEVTEADALKWIDEYGEDPDAVRIGVDPVALGAETEEKMPGWNRFGRELCGLFIEAVSA